jgi:hypothetical protein
VADIVVAPEPLTHWLTDFEQRHGPASWTATAAAVLAVGADGNAMRLRRHGHRGARAAPDAAGFQGVGDEELGGRAVAMEWREGNGELESFALAAGEIKVTVRLVHGRTSKCGSSQARSARRREVVDPGLQNTNRAATLRAGPIDLAEPLADTMPGT